MPFDREDYKNWAGNSKQNGEKPCIKQFCNEKNECPVVQLIRNLVYKDSNAKPKHTKNESQPSDPIEVIE